MNKPRLLIDQDDVLAATNAKLAQMIHNNFGLNLASDTFLHHPFQSILSKEDQKKLYEAIHEVGFFTDIPVMEGAQEAIIQLQDKYDIFVATAAMEFPNSFREKYDWLQEHFPTISWKNFIFCGDKSIFAADYLIDDMPYNLATFKGKGLLFDAVHNRTENAYERVINWAEVLQKLL